MATTDPAVVPLAEAAAVLGICKRTAYELARRGEFPVPVLTVGRSRKVSRRRLEEFVDGTQAGAA